MPINVNGIDAVLDEIKQDVQRLRQSIILEMMYTGEEAVKLQRGSHGYLDQTGNLTSSIGYMVLDHGHVVTMSNFAQVKARGRGRPKGAKSGSAIGRAAAAALAKKYASDDLALVVVAGMDYASHVEAKGLNVIDTAQLHIHGHLDERIKQRLAKAMANINKRLNR